MFGRKFYAAFLIFMTLIAALGAWAMIDGAIAWRERPRIEIDVGPQTRLSWTDPSCTGGVLS